MKEQPITRRGFVKSMAVAGSIAAVGVPESFAVEPDAGKGTAPPVRVDPGRKTVKEAPRSTPVAAEVDVLVVGGGPAGVTAALAAGREGAKTLVVERHGMLGGMWTAGLVSPIFRPVSGWVVTEILKRTADANITQAKSDVLFDPERMKYVFERMLAEAGVEFWYHCPFVEPIVEDGHVRGAIVESKSGRDAILARVVIDCTGDGDVAARAGVPFHLGRESDGVAQPMTLMFQVEDANGIPTGMPNVLRQLNEAIQKHDLKIVLPYDQLFGTPHLISIPRDSGAPGRSFVVQATHVYRFDGTDMRDVTIATALARQQVHEIFMPALKRVPGCEHIRLSATAPSIGVRESRHMEGRYTLSARKGEERFEDAISVIGFHTDIHEVSPQAEAVRKWSKPRSESSGALGSQSIPARPPEEDDSRKYGSYKGIDEIPYRCLVPKTVTGLLFAGRCISGTHRSHAAFRVTGTCMGMGQGAGLAAAMAVAKGIRPDELDGRAVRAALEARGVWFPEKPE